MNKRYLLIKHNGEVGIVINSNNNGPGALETGAQRFNEQKNGYTYYVIDRLNPPSGKEDNR